MPCTYLSITVFVAILESQLATAALNGSFMWATVSRGCPQVGVLSPLLWCLVADIYIYDMTERLNKEWCIYSGYADDICLWAVGKFPNMVSELMQLALHTVETCIYKRKLPDFFEPLFFGVTLHCSMLVKHLGLVLDSQLTWREHVIMNINVKKAHNRYVGLRPKVVTWLYISIIRQSITSALVVCRSSCQTASAKKTKQDTNIVCLVITGDTQHSYGCYRETTHLSSST